jgi:uncharacterized protein (DUF2141 family)
LNYIYILIYARFLIDSPPKKQDYMKRRVFTIFFRSFILLFWLPALISQNGAIAQDTLAQKGTIIVKVTDLVNHDGQLRVSLFAQEEGFPGDPERACRRMLVEFEGDEDPLIRFEDLPFGMYALSIHHDEDHDNDIRTNWVGMPKEGIGTSNEAKGFMGPPKFKDAKFVFDEPELVVPIKMVYL